MFTKFGMGVYWVNSLHGIAFGEDSSIVNGVIATFIALIHPIQWTIALPVGATGPAKRQKKTSCI